MKYLNVAEKNDAAKNIAAHLSQGGSRRREGLSRYNKIYEFEGEVNGQKCQMIMTSTSGHLLEIKFDDAYKNWRSCNPLKLFDAPVYKHCPDNRIFRNKKIKKTLEHEVRGCEGLIIWTDCDREGENIGFEIIEVCRAVKRNLSVYRAKFSEITAVSVRRALQNLEQPDKNISDAVDVRQELDLRIGAVFTRFQTLGLQRVFPSKLSKSIVSYGSCQFPTLGFVVERYREVESFVPKPFWEIRVNHTMNNLSVDFAWEKSRLFDKEACQVLYDACINEPLATVTDVKTKPESKWRPLPLNTVELEKLASINLKISAKETMNIAEKLYTRGFMSYPRTETNVYPEELNLAELVRYQTVDPNWGAFAQGILDSGGPTPRQGNKSDKAHPPIYPSKYIPNLSGNEKKLYEFIVRSFLACCSNDAQGEKTTVSINVGDEKFHDSSIMIIARNYLDVYPYDEWSSKEIHVYQNGQTFNPTSIKMMEGSTAPPNLLTEADLITLMEEHGIGTDATHADHIETIKSRSYVTLADGIHFVPGLLGMGLVEGYDAMGLSMSKPHLRAQLEADLKAICEGRRQPKIVLAEQIAKYREVYKKVTAEANKIDAALSKRYSEQPAENTPTEMPSGNMSLARSSNVTRNTDIALITNADNVNTNMAGNMHTTENFTTARSMANPVTPPQSAPPPNPPNRPSGVQSPQPGDDNELLCYCNTQAIQLTVRKRNNNFGKQFYKCSTDKDDGGCDFFEWAPGFNDESGASTSTANQSAGWGNSQSGISGSTSRFPRVNCACGMPAKKLTVKKESPNEGKEFYGCPKDMNSKCKFFQWADASSSSDECDSDSSSGESYRGGRKYLRW